MKLTVAAGIGAAIWLVALPWVGSLKPVREFVRRNEAAGINPSAVYYTEIEAMGAIGERVGWADPPFDRLAEIRRIAEEE